MPMRLGVMGGTFDPVHIGHLRTAEEALDLLGLNEVLFVPAAIPPHKPDEKTLSFEHRWRMLQLATENNARFRLSDIERRMPGKSFTVNSLSRLNEEFPESELFFLVGRDAFFEMHTWFRYQEVFRLASIVVLDRPECTEEEIGRFLMDKVSNIYQARSDSVLSHPELPSVYLLRNTRMDVSSTRVRELVSTGQSVRYLVPDDVLGYITDNQLYK
ncbi:MAG: nicotinate-nucleotide adenylyltransferase [Syntrophobacteraceae bacterium]